MRMPRAAQTQMIVLKRGSRPGLKGFIESFAYDAGIIRNLRHPACSGNVAEEAAFSQSCHEFSASISGTPSSLPQAQAVLRWTVGIPVPRAHHSLLVSRITCGCCRRASIQTKGRSWS